ncbi:hypothetical protein B0H10DRAFT_396959 [Mycena sp. CBHHK59/15]|nr:hypothetical protein B0H10DRAFT_396959 [Mycena sp. CBHHK59/15]
MPSTKHSQKKPRHRHSPAQLAALNELYEQTEHPPLDQRTALAQFLGMETKTVNAWFQNKRASTKKRPRGIPYEVPALPSSTPPLSSSQPDIDDFEDDDEYFPTDRAPPKPFHSDSLNPSDQLLSESENMGQRMRLRPSEQIEELRKLYAINPLPTTDERQLMASRFGMRFQTVTNWFQSQRSLAKKKKKDEDYPDPTAGEGDSSSLLSPPAAADSSAAPANRGRRSSSISSNTDDNFPSRSRRVSSRRSATPYGSTSAAVSLSARQRRARPEPFQLDALKRLFSKTPTPSIEERSALALEIGMEIGKVTNWFRNLRQSARKREKKLGRRHGGGGSDDDFDYNDGYGTGFYSPSASASASRSATPSSSSLERGDRRGRLRRHVRLHSSDEDDEEEDEEYAEEVVTPSPSESPSPTSSPSHARILGSSAAAALHDDLIGMTDVNEKAVARYPRIPYEDAMLLLSFYYRHT